MKNFILEFCLFLILLSCNKNNDNLSVEKIVKKNRYYDSEIFSEQNQKIYGKWEWLYFTNPGGNVDIRPISKYLEIVKFGIFGYLDDNNLRAIGQVKLSKQDDIETIIQLIPDSVYSNHYDIMTKKVQFQGNDTLLLSDTYIGGLTVLYYKRAK